MKKHSFFYCLTLLASIFTFSVASAQEKENILPFFFSMQERLSPPDISKIKRLRFVTTVDFAPFNFIDSSGYLAGYHVDLFRAICIELKLENECEIEAIPFADLTSHLQEGRADAIIAGIAQTIQSQKDLDFTDSYMRFPARFIAASNYKIVEPFTESLKGQHVGVIENTVHEDLLTSYFPKAQIILFPNEEELFDALQEKKVKAIFGDGLRFSFWLNSKKGLGFQFIGAPYIAPQFLGNGLRIAVPAGKKELVNTLNYALKSLERKGKLKEFYLRYFPIGFY